MSLPVVLGIGEFLWDMLPDGRKAGGAPVNFAYHASLHGTEAWAVSAVGNDALGQELEEEARSHGINLSVSHVGYPTGTVQVTLRGGQPEYEICRDVAWDHIPVTGETLALAGKASAIAFGTLAQRCEESRNTMDTVIRTMPENALKVYDINLRQDFFDREVITDSLGKANVLKINDAELIILKDLLDLSGTSDGSLCRELMDRFSLRLLVLTAGASYSEVYHEGGVSHIETPKVKVVDTVGAGDSFAGAFVGSLLNGMSVEDAHAVAVKTAASVCMHAGAWN